MRFKSWNNTDFEWALPADIKKYATTTMQPPAQPSISTTISSTGISFSSL